jgi:hypothetical protein
MGLDYRALFRPRELEGDQLNLILLNNYQILYIENKEHDN